MSDITKYIKHVEIRSFDRGGFGQVHEADFFPEGSKWAKCKYTRFHTSAIIEKYIRIFGSNPVLVPEKDGQPAHWDFSLVGGVECAFRLSESVAKTFEERVNRDLKAGVGETFAHL